MKVKAELLEKAKTAKSPEELITIAKENGFDLTEEEADRYFTRLNPKSSEIGDDELGDVAGGDKCGTLYDNGHPVVTAFNTCEYWQDEISRKDIPEGGYCMSCYYCRPAVCCILCYCPQRYHN